MAGFPFLRKQSGLTLSGLIFLLVVFGTIAMIAMKVVPAVVEFQSIKKAALDARNTGKSPAEIQAAFDKQANAGYFTSITGKDLNVSKEDGEFEVDFAYDKKLPLFGPASLLLEFVYTTEKQH